MRDVILEVMQPGITHETGRTIPVMIIQTRRSMEPIAATITVIAPTLTMLIMSAQAVPDSHPQLQ